MQKMNKCLFIMFGVLVLGVSSNSESKNFFTEIGSFASAFVRSPKGVGSFIPSSPFLSRAMTRYVECKDHPIKILEVGAGTGPITEKIVEKMKDGDLLDVIEIDPKLCEILKQKFGTYDNVHIHCLSVSDWNPSYQYDFIVSMVPFNSFDANLVKAILEHYKKIIKHNGILSFVEFALTSKIRKAFSIGAKKQNYIKNLTIRSNFGNEFQFDKDLVLLNVPPAHVYHLKIRK